MSKFSYAAASLVAAIPAGVLTTLMVMHFFKRFEYLWDSQKLMLFLSTITLLLSTGVTLIPIAILVFAPKPDTDEETDEDEAEKAEDDEADGDDGDDMIEDEEDDLVAAEEGDELEMDDGDLETAEDVEISDGDEDDIFAEGDEDEFEAFDDEIIEDEEGDRG